MVVSNRDRVGRALELLKEGLGPWVARELQGVYQDRWEGIARAAGMTDVRVNGSLTPHWDTTAIIRVLLDEWEAVFGRKLDKSDRNLVHELRETRNRWAHQQSFTLDDTYRALDSAHRLLTAVAAGEQAAEVDRQRQELLRARYEEQTRRESRRAATAATEGQPRAGLTPWREIVTPHPDVASGRYQQAEFAADLGQVHRGEASDEYQRPRDFFRRTYLTEGLKHLLVDALRRLDGSGGDPVVKLQTNFGGGKTHAMLALYHLVSDVSLDDLPGLEPVLAEAGVAAPPAAQQVVIVGTALSPGQAHRRPDGTVVHTMWGELAWQLLGADGYALVAEADRAGVSPGSDALRELLAASAPCLILVDEWVAYLRQLVDVKGLPAGSFDANYSFAQALTEAVRAVPRTLLVATLPESDIEIGGEAGRQALTRLENVFGRVEAVWRPASAEESFEIVRRRLFEPIADPALFPARDAVVRAFGELYRGQAQEFPPDCREGSYEERIRAAYPIHPELFDRLYEDWSSLERFQRTRGVLRLMAKVIHALWESDDRNLLIMPGTVPVGDAEVLSELTRYLEDNWVPVIEKDVDGPASLPLELDRENPNLGRYSACRRVARALYLGSAPTLRAANRGIEDRQLKLGCVQPGETVATFGDALRRLTEQATYLYVDGHRYWYSTQPSVTRLAQDRAAQQSEEQVDAEVERRLRLQLTKRGDFARVHVAPTSSADVPDEADARLVVLGPGRVHVPRAEDSPALQAARQILDNRGNAPRIYRNALVFLAADDRRVPALREAVRSYLAWRSIQEQQEELNLDAFQRRQAETRSKSADETVENQIPEAWVSLLVPAQPDPRGAVEWDESRVSGAEPLAVRAGKKLAVEGKLAVQYGGRTLRAELDRIPLWQGDSVAVGQLMDWYGQYLYLQRLASPEVLLGAIAEGAGAMLTETEGFAYADGIDATTGRFSGLVLRQRPSRVLSTGLVVRAEAALRQQAEEQREREARQTVYPGGSGKPNGEVNNGHGTYDTGGGTAVVEPEKSKAAKYRRFHGTVELPTMKVPSTAGQIAQEVIAHLEGLVGARVRITLEIEADVPNGVPDDVVRTVTENARTLKFGPGSGFEEE